MKANFCPRAPSRRPNPAQYPKPPLQNDLRPIAGGECGWSRRKPHRTSGHICTKGFQARPEPLDGLAFGNGVDGVAGPRPIAGPDAEYRRRKNRKLLSATDADDSA